MAQEKQTCFFLSKNTIRNMVKTKKITEFNDREIILTAMKRIIEKHEKNQHKDK